MDREGLTCWLRFTSLLWEKSCAGWELYVRLLGALNFVSLSRVPAIYDCSELYPKGERGVVGSGSYGSATYLSEASRIIQEPNLLF